MRGQNTTTDDNALRKGVGRSTSEFEWFRVTVAGHFKCLTTVDRFQMDTFTLCHLTDDMA